MAAIGKTASDSNSSEEARTSGFAKDGDLHDPEKQPLPVYTAEGSLEVPDDPKESLHRGLEARQISMIAIGGYYESICTVSLLTHSVSRWCYRNWLDYWHRKCPCQGRTRIYHDCICLRRLSLLDCHDCNRRNGRVDPYAWWFHTFRDSLR